MKSNSKFYIIYVNSLFYDIQYQYDVCTVRRFLRTSSVEHILLKKASCTRGYTFFFKHGHLWDNLSIIFPSVCVISSIIVFDMV